MQKLVQGLETLYVFHRQKNVIDALLRGEIKDIKVSQNLAVDKIVSFGLREGFLKTGLKSFPDSIYGSADLSCWRQRIHVSLEFEWSEFLSKLR